MSLRSLLPLGKTFGPALDRRGRYRLGGGPLAEAEALGRAQGARKGVFGSSREGGSPLEGASEWARAQARGARRAKGNEGGKRRVRLPVWCEQLVLTLLGAGNRRRGTREVQTEMDFEGLKVARNDLVTSDVEVVAKPRPSPARVRLSAACRARVLRVWWEAGARRLRRLSNLMF